MAYIDLFYAIKFRTTPGELMEVANAMMDSHLPVCFDESDTAVREFTEENCPIQGMQGFYDKEQSKAIICISPGNLIDMANWMDGKLKSGPGNDEICISLPLGHPYQFDFIAKNTDK